MTATRTTCLRDMPGGLAGVRQMVADFHRRGVRVLFPIMLWDQGTHDYGMPNWEATAKLFAEAGADGLNGDTMRGVPRAFRDASDRAGHPLVLEPESGLDSDEMLMWNNMTWGYWRYSSAPQAGRRTCARQLPSGAHRQPLQVARDPPHGEYLPALGARQDRRPATRLL